MTTEDSQLPPADAGRLDLPVVPLVERLRLHIARMAPHQKERFGGALLIECVLPANLHEMMPQSR